jgi:CubicO group peptidase (beta-lactamase class C family)
MRPLKHLIAAVTSLTIFHSTSAQTGIPNTYMTACDNYVTAFLNQYDIPGATLTITRHGKTVYMRAFGHANLAETEVMQPYHRFRIASLSKSITAVTIMKMVEDGLLNLDDTVFGENGLLADDPLLSHVDITDTRIYSITLRQLLHHTAGWDSSIDCFPNPATPYPYYFGGCDPFTAPLHIAYVTGTSNPVTEPALIEFLLEKGLDHDPGTHYAYSNIAYLMIGRVIEYLTNMSYEEYVQQTILEPLGICDMTIANNLLSEKQEREVEYRGNGYNTLSIYNTGQLVPWEYGGLNVNAMDAHGGWIASANDLVKLLVAVDNLNTKPDILTGTSISEMITGSNQNNEYGLGWGLSGNGAWFHTGAIDGTATVMMRNPNGYTWSMLLNKRIIDPNLSNAFWNSFVNIPWNCIAGISTNVTHDLMLHPLQNASDITATSIGNNQIEISWTPGDGTGRMLVCSQTGAVNAFPLDGQDYTASTTLGEADDLGNGNYVVYNGTENSVILTGLDLNQTYHFRLFEYNKNDATGQLPLYKLCNGATFVLDETTLNIVERKTSTISFHVVPNPANDFIQIISDKEMLDVEIYDTRGLLLIDQKLYSKQQLDVTHLPQGIYFIKCKDMLGNYSAQKFMKL